MQKPVLQRRSAANESRLMPVAVGLALSLLMSLGLGLSLVKQIAERHGGHVRCEDREGGGSCFVIVLPAEAKPT